MPIQITQEEGWALNILTNTAVNKQAELQKAIAARNVYIQMLEARYNAVFNPATGGFAAKPKGEKPKVNKEV